MNRQYAELYEKFSRLQWLMHRQRFRKWMEGGPMADPTRGQGRILAILKMQDGLSTKDLSYLLGIRVSSLNELLSKLEKGGYVTREPSEEDRRVMLVKLTDKGRETKLQDVDCEGIFGRLTPEEQSNLGQYLDRLIEALEAEVGDDRDDDVFEAMRGRLGEHAFERFGPMMRGRPHFKGGFGPCAGFHGHHCFVPKDCF